MSATRWGFLFMAVLSSALPGLAPADEKRAGEIVAGRCALCHGKNGEAASADNPRLAGQHAEYIARAAGRFQERQACQRNNETAGGEPDARRNGGLGQILRG